MEASRKNAKPGALRRVLACLVSTALAVAFTPVVAWGAEGTTVGNFTVTGGVSGTDYTYENNTLTIISRTPITISNTDSNTATTDHIVVNTSVTADITLSGVKIQLSDGKQGIPGTCAFKITSGATVNLTLVGNNTLESGWGKAGLEVLSSSTLIISGGSSDSLSATGGSNSAGIGGGYGSKNGEDGGNITINGGKITATGNNSAGIGGGYGSRGGSGGNITINSGEVKAVGGTGAGIGGGFGGTIGGSGDNITINGGEVTATADSGAGIGGGNAGDAGGNGGTITINGGTVNATSTYGAGIGGGSAFATDQDASAGNGGTITINGGTVNATSTYGAGIGGGSHLNGKPGGNGGTVTINGGVVTAANTYNSNSLSTVAIGGGVNYTSECTFSTGDAGNAVIFASSNTSQSPISDTSGKAENAQNPWSGVIFEGNEGKVYAPSSAPTVTPTESFTIPAGKTLKIDSDKTLTISQGKVLTISGADSTNNLDAANVVNNGTIINKGTIENNGTISNTGKIENVITLKDGGDVIDSTYYTYKNDSSITALPTNVTKTGYTFDSWHSNSDLSGDAVSIIPNNCLEAKTYYAKWNVNQYTITFNTDGGSAVASITQNYGTDVTAPANPTKTGYSFIKWDKDIPATMPAENITITAQWQINQYTITFDTDGGTTIDPITQDYGTDVSAPADPTKTGYTFAGWYSDAVLSQPYTFTTMPVDGIKLYAKWTANAAYIVFEENSGTAVSDMTGTTDEAISNRDMPTTSRTGYTFEGWYSDSSFNSKVEQLPASFPAGTTTYYAKWKINQYTIAFEENGGSDVENITQNYGTAVSLPTSAKPGYTFAYWCSDSDLATQYTGTTMPAENKTLYAKWNVNQYTITFESNGGTAVDPITQDYGSAVVKPADPTRSGYSFGGWYSDQALTQAYVFGTMPAEDTTLYAKWSYIPDPTPLAPEVGETVEGVSIGGGSVEASVTVTGGATTDSQGNKVDGSVSIGSISAGEGAVAIPETVTVNGRTYLVTEVEPGALAGNTAVESVTLPASVTSIGAGAFEGCTGLTSVNVPAGVIRIEADTFAGCTALESVKLEGEVTEVGPSAFNGCTSLEAIDLPAAVSTVGEGAFAGCTSLRGIELSASGAVIGKGAFEGCSSLASVKLPAGAVIGARAFANSGIAKLTVPRGAVIGERAFQGCSELKSVTVSKGVKALPAYAFKGCAKLAKVTLPSGMVKIERSAFSGCKSLRSVVLPKSVVAIGKNALYGASKVKKLTVESKQLTKKGVTGCLKGSSVTTVYVPKSKLDAYGKLFTRSVCGKKVTLKPIK